MGSQNNYKNIHIIIQHIHNILLYAYIIIISEMHSIT